MKFLKKNDQIIKYLYILSFAFFNVSFNRLAEFGTDKIGQLLIIILVIKLFERFALEKIIVKLMRLYFYYHYLATV